MSEPTKKRGAGRPPKHSKEEVLGWAETYWKSCGEGMSDRIFLGKKGLDRHYFLERAERDIPELSAIIQKGHAIREEFYAKLGIAGTTGQIKGFNLGAYVWITKHMMGWWDQSIPNGFDLTLGQNKSATKVEFKTSWGATNEPSAKDES